MRTIVTSGALVLAAVLAAPAFGGPIFMQYEGIDGDVTASGHDKWIEVQSWQWATPPPAVPRAPAPAGVAVGGPGRVSLVRKVDKASPLLSKAATTGKVVPVVLLDVPAPPGQASKPYLQFRFTTVFVTSYNNSGGAAPTESLSLNFTKVEYRYAEQKAPQKGVSPNRAGNMTSAPAPSAK